MSDKVTKIRRSNGSDESETSSEPFGHDGNVRFASEGDQPHADGNRLDGPPLDGQAANRPVSSFNQANDGQVAEIDRIQSLLDEEPLSLAEEIAEECDRTGKRITRDEIHERYEQIKQGDIHIAELQRMSMPQLIEQARKENLTEIHGIKKQDLIFKILKERVKRNGLMFGEGTLEVLPDSF